MSVHTLLRNSAAPPRRFRHVGELLAFEFPDPVWVSADLRQSQFAEPAATQMREFFNWFGFAVEIQCSAESLVAGWEYLLAEIGAAIRYRTRYPATFAALYQDWSEAQVAYVDAVVQGDQVAAQALSRRIGLWQQLHEKMRTPEGCALKG